MKQTVILVAGGKPGNWPDSIVEKNKDAIWIGIDRGAYYLLGEGVLPNHAIGDFDSLSEEELLFIEKKITDIHYSVPEKDDTDTQLALALAIKKYPEANFILIGATGGRLDHFLNNLWLPYDPRFREYTNKISIKDKQNTICYFVPGKYEVQKEEDKKYIGFVCLSPIQKLTLDKVKYPLLRADVEYPVSYASNEFLEEYCQFSFETGLLATIQSRDKSC